MSEMYSHKGTETADRLLIRGLTKSYGTLSVLDHLNMELDRDTCYCLMSPSGSGKTTLFRILMGLETADGGTVTACRVNRSQGADSYKTTDSQEAIPFSQLKISPIFQENRLCSSFSPIENVLLTAGRNLNASQIRPELLRLLPEECLTRPVSTLSGGMKRRVAILRALLCPSDILLMDEPFTGLDEDMKLEVIRYIKEKRQGRFLIISTHQEEDAELMGGTIIRI